MTKLVHVEKLVMEKYYSLYRYINEYKNYYRSKLTQLNVIIVNIIVDVDVSHKLLIRFTPFVTLRMRYLSITKH